MSFSKHKPSNKYSSCAICAPDRLDGQHNESSSLTHLPCPLPVQLPDDQPPPLDLEGMDVSDLQLTGDIDIKELEQILEDMDFSKTLLDTPIPEDDTPVAQDPTPSLPLTSGDTQPHHPTQFVQDVTNEVTQHLSEANPPPQETSTDITSQIFDAEILYEFAVDTHGHVTANNMEDHTVVQDTQHEHTITILNIESGEIVHVPDSNHQSHDVEFIPAPPTTPTRSDYNIQIPDNSVASIQFELTENDEPKLFKLIRSPKLKISSTRKPRKMKRVCLRM